MAKARIPEVMIESLYDDQGNRAFDKAQRDQLLQAIPFAELQRFLGAFERLNGIGLGLGDEQLKNE
jgi:hypothetical protein